MRTIAVVSGIVVTVLGVAGPAATQTTCIERPTGWGSRTECSDGTTATTRPNGFGGYRTTIQPPLVIEAPRMPQPTMPYPDAWQPPQECVTRPTSWGGSKTFCR